MHTAAHAYGTTRPPRCRKPVMYYWAYPQPLATDFVQANVCLAATYAIPHADVQRPRDINERSWPYTTLTPGDAPDAPFHSCLHGKHSQHSLAWDELFSITAGHLNAPCAAASCMSTRMYTFMYAAVVGRPAPASSLVPCHPAHYYTLHSTACLDTCSRYFRIAT